MPFTTHDALTFLYDQEKQTLRDLALNLHNHPITLSLYGRNPSRDMTTCSNDKHETWSPTGYGSVLSMYRGARRHNNEDVLKFIGRSIRSMIENWRRCLQIWGKPPGEDSRWPPCGDVSEQLVDTDDWRHVNLYGVCMAALDPFVQEAGGFTLEQFIEGVAWPQYQYTINSISGTHPREYLRIAFKIDTLLGCHEVFKAANMTPDAMGALNVAVKIFEYAYANAQSQKFISSEGHLYRDWNYGKLDYNVITDSFIWPFQWGWNYLTSQPWYTGTNIQALFHLWFRCAADDALRVMCPDIMEVAKSVAEFFDPRNITDFNKGTLDWAGTEFYNSKVQGWTPDGIARIGVEPMTMEEYQGLSDTDRYCRLTRVLDFHEFDGGYHKLTFTDPAGKVHERVHRSRIGSAWGYEMGDPEYNPRFETGQNCYGMPDILYASAASQGDEYLRDLAIYATYDYRAFANSSDVLRSRSQSIKSLAPPANGMIYARQWHWAMMAGVEVLEGEWANFQQ